ncbi:MAG TPA: hypothetical protein VF555_12135 [Variovorax sp.]
MNNFAWVDDLALQLRAQGQPRLAYLIDDVPHKNFRGQHALVEALVPEALALARSLDIPWLEVYFKHWLCSSRADRYHGEIQLGEVVEAYEQAHQDTTQGCPQSVCLTQDLVLTYANVDGPGWVPERLAACDETLARIDPSWGCFGCIVIERARAMGDQGQPREAVLYLQRQRDAATRAGKKVTSHVFSNEVEQWLIAGDAQTALQVLDASEGEVGNSDPRERLCRLLQRCRALAMAGQSQAAWDRLPSFADTDVLDYVPWCRAAAAIARALPERNTPALGQALWTTIEYLHQVGNHRRLIDLVLEQVPLALERKVPWLAAQALAHACHHLPLLRADLGAAAQVEQAAQALASATALPAPCGPAELVAWLDSPEAAAESDEAMLQWLTQACQALPADEALAMRLDSARSHYGRHAQARIYLQAVGARNEL